MIQILQVAGAILLLAGFVATQWGVLRDTSVPYLAVNAAGAAWLAVIAFLQRDWGFVLLEGTWASISAAGLVRTSARTTSSSSASSPHTTNRGNPTGHSGGQGQPKQPAVHEHPPAPTPPTTSTHRYRTHRWKKLLPPHRAAHFAGDELSQHGRLIHLFRDSYAGAQGRQWLQPHILWWILIVLRRNGVRADFTTLDSPELAHTVTTLGLPAGHTDVHPTDQTSMNFRLWWPILAKLARAAYRPWWSRRWPCRGYQLPDAGQIEDRAWRLGLRPWMSSASFEEVSGIARALACIHDHDRRGQVDADDFMVRILLPELLTVELHWLHALDGRPRTGNRTRVDLVLLRRYDNALAKWTHGHYLTPLDHMYLRAGDILQHLASLPEESVNPLLRRIMDLYNELRRAQDPNSPPPLMSPNVVEPRPATTHSDMPRPEESEKPWKRENENPMRAPADRPNLDHHERERPEESTGDLTQPNTTDSHREDG